MEAGQQILKQFDKFKDNFRMVKGQLYKQADKLIGGAGLQKATLDIPETSSFIDKIVGKERLGISAMGGKSSYVELNNLSNTIKKGKLTVEKALGSIDRLKGKVGYKAPASTGDEAIVKKVIAELDNAVDNIYKTVNPEISKAITEAKNFYKENINLITSKIGKDVTNLAQQPEVLAGKLITSNITVQQIGRIKKVLGKDTVEQAGQSITRDIFEKASMKGDFSVSKFNSLISKYKVPNLKAILPEKTFNALMDIRTLGTKLGKSEKIVSGSQTAFLTNLILDLNAVVRPEM